jgi:type II secretory pathway component PulF
LWLPKLLIWQAIWSVLLLQPLFPSINPDNVVAGFGRYGMILLIVCLPLGLALQLGAVFAGWWWRQPANQTTRDRISLCLPVMARVAKMRALAAFTRVLRRLLLAGISPEPAFVGAARAVPNTVLAERFLAGAAIVRAGRGLDEAVQATGLMGHDPVQLLVTGQKTGQWLEMLDRVTMFYQDEAAKATDAARSAQKRIGGIVTLVSMGYVMIVSTHGLATLGFKWTESWTAE